MALHLSWHIALDEPALMQKRCDWFKVVCGFRQGRVVGLVLEIFGQSGWMFLHVTKDLRVLSLNL